MAKFYVQSGTLRTIVQAASSRRAAVWAVHQAMQQILPLEEGQPTTGLPADDSVDCSKVAVLSDTVSVSQTGFTSTPEVTLPTMEVVQDWNEMCSALHRLEELLRPAVAA